MKYIALSILENDWLTLVECINSWMTCIESQAWHHLFHTGMAVFM